MYVRVFKADEIKKWNVKTIDDLPILALKLWNPKKDSDYSIFKFKAKEDSYWAYLRALVSNSTEWGYEVDLLILSDEFLKNYHIEDGNDDLVKCSHSNIKDLTFKDYKAFIDYTYNNQDKIISIKLKDIIKILDNLSENDSDSFEVFCNSSNKKKEVYKTINNICRRNTNNGKESLPKFLKDLC